METERYRGTAHAADVWNLEEIRDMVCTLEGELKGLDGLRDSLQGAMEQVEESASNSTAMVTQIIQSVDTAWNVP